ncbi:4-hydroxybenzoate polyprenyltransferase [Caldanaerobius fijiensis DSM 17918]|uniref:4-hydroxybenzoate polyprenyltransferase n=1 Tax=Caldanaerobius fijiensis DSM 17918 TaxID=1121256 RepID=A0A1M4VKZ1_9THEO|nr:decaprenyl-phosphate phosphoribosyltransferase [Caldanaerobius fijiensis]SHE69547.1 4-hydroxybenzoate polyprenyltransferase [Caldanaerobius fijiensis DSM 17918]
MYKHLIEVLKALRPKQWIKNIFVFAAIIYSGELFNLRFLRTILFVFILFCLISGGAYVVNDIIDINRDRMHPVKKNRPIASGKVSIFEGLITAVVLEIISLVIAFNINTLVGVVCLVYLTEVLVYSLYVKGEIILDSFFVAFGFVLRVIAGSVAIGKNLSPWLTTTVSLLALFLALSKRKNELLFKDASKIRGNLKFYSQGFLDQMISSTVASTIVVYSLYTFLSGHNKKLMLTIPFVIYGLYRYLYLLYDNEKGGAPEDTVTNDIPLVIDIMLWFVFTLVIIYKF